MNKTYLVMFRSDDKPVMLLQTKGELEELLTNELKNKFDFLENVPDLTKFPAWSVFIFKGKVIIPNEKTVIKEWQIT